RHDLCRPADAIPALGRRTKCCPAPRRLRHAGGAGGGVVSPLERGAPAYAAGHRAVTPRCGITAIIDRTMSFKSLDHIRCGRGELLDPDTHARQYSNVRKAHETELIEDYVELIADLLQAKGEARAVELAQRMGVTQATVGKMIRRLDEAGLVTRQPYRSIFLTDAGIRMAQVSRKRHLVVLRFLRA